ncbi:hypothetical protein ENUP19_0257G0089 [Entamoeba nuttalli]|uniref:Uncharacterized protein n=2 Tax=Entamoeba nuttalli TaxID=412467 RepID=K2H030_ENTNP|nr:hypothetical protein ENU1_078580 [Entamoeba nuttalli P19]EKE40813.1 hypothetical protein ENU1_078580 [Entamoeba nuttalli P19]|eukprot:XP_008856851.1 hypothetical protein ENU1_078580 [Entamoeba nuttalli P19]
MSNDSVINYYNTILLGRWKKTNSDINKLYNYALTHPDKRVSADAMYDAQMISGECDIQKLLFAAERYWESEMDIKLYNGVSFDECILLMNDCFEKILEKAEKEDPTNISMYSIRFGTMLYTLEHPNMACTYYLKALVPSTSYELQYLVFETICMLSVKYELSTAQTAAFEQLKKCLEHVNVSDDETTSFYQQTIDILLFSILILLSTNGHPNAIAEQFNLYCTWMAKPRNQFKVTVTQNTFQSYNNSITPDQLFKTCVVLDKAIESDMKGMINYNRVRILFKFIVSILKVKSYDNLFSTFELTEKQLVDLIPEEHRELFLYVCSKIHILRQNHLEQISLVQQQKDSNQSKVKEDDNNTEEIKNEITK